MKKKLFLLLCTLLTMIGVQAQIDVTATYITNPSFETDGSTNLDKPSTAPSGWTYSGNSDKYELHNSSSVTDNGFGPTSPSAGDYYYYLRRAWAGNSAKIAQVISSLPAGYYTFTAKVKTMYANSATSSYYLSANGVNASATTFTIGAANGFGSLAWTTKSVSFSLTEPKENVEIALNVNWVSGGSQIAIDDVHLTVDYFATTEDYNNLDAAIAATEAKTIGFEVDEYAPYTNAAALIALAAAKAVDRNVPQSQTTIQGYTNTMNNHSWTANDERMNAFYRGNFSEYTTGDISGDNRAVATGWSNTNTYNCGVVGLQNTEPAQGGETTNPGLAGLTSQKALYLRGGYSTAYGSTPGYTVPLKANAIYTLSFTYGGWGQFMNNAGTVKVKDGSSTDVLSQSVNTTGKGNESTEAWQTFNEQVKTNEAGNYTVDLNFVAGGQSAFSDFSLLFQNYMVKASATELPVGNMTADTWYYFDIATEGEYKLTASSNLGDIKYVTDGTLAENTSGTAFSVDANNVMNLPDGRYYVKSSSAQSLTVAVYAVATAEDYENLNAAINAAENNIGFEDGEYAPYNNKEMLTTLAEAKAIDQSVDNPQATVQGYTTALAAANWTANDGEVNAIRWNIADYPDTGAETKVPTGGFVGSDSGSRISHKSADGGNVGLRGLDQYMALMVISNTDATYGETEGYTLPLKATTVYEFKFKYAGWGECGTPTITIWKGSDKIEEVELSTPAKTGNDNEDAWEAASVVFQTNAAGDYKVKFSTSDGRDAFGDLELKKAPSTVPVTIGENGYATFASPYALDLTKANLPSGLKAYKAQAVNSTSVHFEEFNQTVPANTGILFEGTASETYNIPVVASGDAVSGNLFRVNEGNGYIYPSYVESTTEVYYFAMIKDSDPLTFGKFNPASYKYPSNKAYLIVAKNQSPEARLVVSFDEEDPTGINAVEAAEAEAAGLKDGKYLIGNKIVLVKNGMKYDANGQKLN